jgi:hypothetical protein
MINIKRVLDAFEDVVDDRLYNLENMVYPFQLLNEWVCNEIDLTQTEINSICRLQYRGYNLNIDKGILGFYTIEIKRSPDVQ